MKLGRRVIWNNSATLYRPDVQIGTGTIERMLDGSEADPEVGPMYEVKLDQDGSTITAFEDELEPNVDEYGEEVAAS